jgi:hypothetical protein
MDYSLLLGIKQRSYSVNSKPASPHLELHTAQTGGGGTGRQEQPFFREDEGGINACLVVGPGTYYIGVIDLLQVSSGRHCHFTLSLTAIDCHSLGMYTITLMSLLSCSIGMPVVAPWLMQVWNFKKRMESAAKACCLCKDSKGISAVTPPYCAFAEASFLFICSARAPS